MIVAVDPGTTQSALVWMGEAEGGGEAVHGAIMPNAEVRDRLSDFCRPGDVLAIEMVASYGMPVGRDVFETCVWIGRFIEAWDGPFEKIYRKDVKMCLCGHPRAKDANIRQALIDLYGGSRRAAVGVKKAPGPLYGFKRDMWAALGVAVTYRERHKAEAACTG